MHFLRDALNMCESPLVPRLETARLWLRPWSPNDIRAYAAIIRHSDVIRYMGYGMRYKAKRAIVAVLACGTDIESRWRIRQLVRHWRQWGFGEWAVEEKATGLLIGQLGLTHHGDFIADPAKIEIGWLLARHAWGRGFATEGAKACLSYAFNRMKIDRLVSITSVQNVRSLGVMGRIGLTPVGRTQWKGSDVVWWAIDRSAWRSWSLAHEYDQDFLIPEQPMREANER